MILRKPYAFFIKMFKPIHLFISTLIAYLIYMTTRVLNFLSTYIYSNIDVVGDQIQDRLINNFLFIIPLIIIVFSLIILGIMFKKKKTVTFYVMTIFSIIITIIIALYASNFLGAMEKSIVSIKSVKLIHDLVLINIIIESVLFIIFIIRGMGVNFKKFNFDSEISKLDISESDKEEFELDINVDLSESKRKRKRRLRYLKYAYIENKFLINCIVAIVIALVGIGIYTGMSIYNKTNKEGNIYSADSFNFGVNKTILLNTDYKGTKLTDDYLVVVNTRLKSNFSSNSLFLSDFKLSIGEASFEPTTKYANSLVDLGITYDESILPIEYTDYLIVYEIPEKYTSSDMIFSYNNKGNLISIKLNPKSLLTETADIVNNVGEEIDFNKILGDIKFKILDYEIRDKFIFYYNYCINTDDCINSVEYLKSSIDKNFDKYILRIDVEYTNNSNLNMPNFYKFFSEFGSIYYKLNDTWYYQVSDFEELISSKTKQGNNTYIGINSNIINADSIKLVFKIRDSKYEYILKQVNYE